MQILLTIFGEGKDLTVLQMSSRGVVMFFIALALIRVSGRRSFGVRAPLDNIITISLGAVMSRAIVGASAFLPVVVCCFVIVLLHRLFGWLISRSKLLGRLIEGEKIILFENGIFIDSHMKKALVGKEDVMQGVRRAASTEDMSKITNITLTRIDFASLF